MAKNKIFIYEAIDSLYPDAKFAEKPETDGEYDDIIWETKPDGITEKKVNDEISRLETTTQYKRDRMDSFPSIGDQLDMQYWDAVNDTTKWKDAITKIKTDNKKP